MSLPTEDILKMSDAELEKYLASAAFGTMGRSLAFEEYTRRKLSSISRPHWSTVPSFWLLVVSVIISILAVVISVTQLIRENQLSPKALLGRGKIANLKILAVHKKAVNGDHHKQNKANQKIATCISFITTSNFPLETVAY